MWQQNLNSSRNTSAVTTTLSPSLTAHNLRQSRYSPQAVDDFTTDHHHRSTNNINSASASFQSPARGAASFIPRAYNSASRYSVLGNLNRRNRSVSQHDEHSQPVPNTVTAATPVQYSGEIHNTITSNEIDHSVDLGSDFSKFLFEDQLADIKIYVSKLPTQEEFSCISNGEQVDLVTGADSTEFVVIPAHRIVLASRCQYFYAKFCREWGDGNALVAKFPEFSDQPMREFLRYLYTGKLRIELASVMGIMRISSYFNMEELVKSCKMYLRSGKLNAFDLCILYCEVRESATDFDEMRSFLTQLIPKKMDNRILCRVLKRIWVSPRQSMQNLETVDEEEPREEHDATTNIVDTRKEGNRNYEAADVESKTIKFNTCLSDDQDSDTIKFEDAVQESGKPSTVTEKKHTTALHSSRGVKESQGSAGVIIDSTEIAEEDKKEESDESAQSRQQNVHQRSLFGAERGQARHMCASNEFENDERRDLQQILMEKLQLSLPRILEEEQTREELLILPREALELLFSNSETCLSEFQLFEVIRCKLLKLSGNDKGVVETATAATTMAESPTKNLPEEDPSYHTTTIQSQSFLKEMLKFVRLPLINMKQLVTSIKFSGFFEDQRIFEALQFQVAKEVLASERLESDIKYEHRGIRTQFDYKHYDLSIAEDVKDQSCVVTTDTGTSFVSHQKVQRSLTIRRDRVCQSPDDSTISAIMGESLPLHGIHYWELKLKTDNPANLKKVFVGLCNKRDNQTLEDVHKSKSAILLNCFDSTFWNNGQQVQVFSNKYIKIKQPMEDTDIIRIAIDLRHATHFERFWADQQQSSATQNEQDQQTQSDRQQPSSSERGPAFDLVRGGSGVADHSYVFGRNSMFSATGRNGGDFGANSDRYLLRDRYPTQLASSSRNARENINVLLNAHNEVMFFNSPCKFHFAFNGSEFHEGVDLNLINLDEAPINLCISLPEHLGVEVQLSRAVYFCDWELIPKEPFLLA